MRCRHCHRAHVTRPRRLCWVCFYTPGIREKYPITSKYGRRGVLDFYGRAPLPPLPTSALPGTPEKIAILQQRAKMRQQLWHPNDGVRDDEGTQLDVA